MAALPGVQVQSRISPASQQRQQMEADRRMALRLQRAEEDGAMRVSHVPRGRAAPRPTVRPAAQTARTTSAHEVGAASAVSSEVAARWRAYFASRQQEPPDRVGTADGSGSDASGPCASGMERCMICDGKEELLLCRGYREADEDDGRATDGHMLCRGCLERWHVAKNELLELNNQPPRSRRECPVCKTELRSSSMRSDKQQCMGLRKIGAWAAVEPSGSDEDDDDHEEVADAREHAGCTRIRAADRAEMEAMADKKHLKVLPEGWRTVRHAAPAGAYFVYHGPNGLKVRSKVRAWRLHMQAGGAAPGVECDGDEDANEVVETHVHRCRLCGGCKNFQRSKCLEPCPGRMGASALGGPEQMAEDAEVVEAEVESEVEAEVEAEVAMTVEAEVESGGDDDEEEVEVHRIENAMHLRPPSPTTPPYI